MKKVLLTISVALAAVAVLVSFKPSIVKAAGEWLWNGSNIYNGNGGYVGIGTANPLEQLSVYEAGTGADWRGRGVFGGSSNVAIVGTYNDQAVVGAHNSALSAWSTLYLNTDPVLGGGGNVITKGNVGIGATGPGARLDVTQPENGQSALRISSGFPAGSYHLDIQPRSGIENGASYIGYDFYTTNSQSTKHAMTFGYDGNIGIGTKTPGAKLAISSGNASLALFGPNATWGGKLYIGASPNQGAASTAQVISTDGNLHLDPAPGKNMYLGFYQARDIYINPNGGNVGIGTANPTEKLDVNGNIKVNDTVKLGSGGAKIKGYSNGDVCIGTCN